MTKHNIIGYQGYHGYCTCDSLNLLYDSDVKVKGEASSPPRRSKLCCIQTDRILRSFFICFVAAPFPKKASLFGARFVCDKIKKAPLW